MSKISILAVKSSAALLHLIGRGGSLPGSIGNRLDPDSLSKLKIDGPVILVTGTNGKTSTANMISSALEHAGYTVVSNRKGDNLKDGITTTLLSAADLNGHVQGAVVLEVDELNVRHVLPYLPVTALVINNFFRDQLDRAREVDQLIQSIEGVLTDYEGTLILNGNDPNTTRVALAAPKAKKIWFGLDQNRYSTRTNTEASEGKFCPRCGHRLEYDYYQYSHIGKFHCPQCGFATPELDVSLQNIDLKDNSFDFHGKHFKGPYEGMYSMYNYAALLAAAHLLDIPDKAIRDTFAHAPQPAGRNERFMNGGQEIILNLIKNPTGANEVMKVIDEDNRDKTAVIVLNDNEQDGRDVSWIYDTHFENLMDPTSKKVICTGTRANDMALRMYYGGYQGDLQVVENLEEAVEQAMDTNRTVYVVATYTALQPARHVITRKVAGQ